ncbi:MAG: hypothetical protein ACK518_03660 [bacterium]
MGYEVKYRLEFDTIKGRSVRLDIEEDRNFIPPTGIIAMNYIFDAPSKAFSIGGSKSLFYSIFKDYIFEAGDKLTVYISPGNVNNGIYTIIDYGLFINENLGTIAVVFLLDENVTAATGTGIEVSVTPDPIIDLKGYSETPIELNYPNGEFDKMCPIRESRMRIKVLADVVNAEDFYITKETQYKVKLYINSNIEWVGWLDNDYITEPFLDTNVFIELSANDGLSLLKNIPLQDFDGNQIWNNVMSILDYIKYSLYQTKLELNFWSFINMYPYDEFNIYPVRNASIGGTWDNDAFYYSFTKSQTFLKGPRDFDDCYEVLSKIMQAFGCTLFQSQGSWHIINMDDRILGVLGGTLRDANGTAIFAITNYYTFINIDIGLNRATKLINADALTSIEKPFKEVVIKYSFDTPPVYFRNFDLLDGELLSSTSTLNTYSVLYWNNLFNPIQTYLSSINRGNYSNSSVYTKIKSELDTTTNSELIRYLSLNGTLTQNGGSARTTEYLINKGDVIEFGFTVRVTLPIFATSACFVWVILTNGTTNAYLGNDGNWYTNPNRQIQYIWDQNEDRRFWKTRSGIFSKPAPFSGYLSIQFSGLSETDQAHEIHFRDVVFNINPNMSLAVNAAGYEFKSENIENLKSKYSNELFISHSDNISIMGTLTNNNSTPISLKNWRYRANQNPILPFAQYVNRAYFRTMHRRFQRIEGRLYDIFPNDMLITPLQNISFDEISQDIFMATTLQIDIRNESAEFTMIGFVGKDKFQESEDRSEIGAESFRYLDVKAKDYDDPIKEPKTPVDYKWGIFGIISSQIRRGKIRRLNNYS